MQKLIAIKVYQHRTRVFGKYKTPFRLYVIYRANEDKHLAFNNINWLPEFTNNDNINVNYIEALPDNKLAFIQANTF